jgi:uncharacterized damage-inducible protein DinB
VPETSLSDLEAKWVRRVEREKQARQSAEKLLEERSLQLHYSNEALKKSTTELQSEVERQTLQLRQALMPQPVPKMSFWRI